jgi:integrase/recombinase XerD
VYEGTPTRLQPSEHGEHDRATRAGAGRPVALAQRRPHSLATRMLRQGASLPEIGLVLRHRAVQTTEIYAKVDLAGLRALAQPWPLMGGAQ